eukprot:m.152122 g.152122  ORF g.152122 m.152122 type:complete len:154 (+) comp11701_c0_seq19:192-653(+)
MAANVADSKHFDNKYDNTNEVADRTTRDIAAGYTAFTEAQALKAYLEALEVEARVSKSTDKVRNVVFKPDGSQKVEEIELKNLVPSPSEFEQVRRRVIVILNDMNAKGKVNELKQLYADFDTESLWELSSKLANYLVDKRRRDGISASFNIFA